MFAAFVRFAVTVAAVPLCAEYLDGVKMLDLTNALVVGVILAAIYTVLRPVMRLILSVLNFCTLGLLYIAVDAWLVWTAAGLVENSVVFDNYWMALAVAVIINVAAHAGRCGGRRPEAVNMGKDGTNAYFSGQ